jgi:hypothetical protein
MLDLLGAELRRIDPAGRVCGDLVMIPDERRYVTCHTMEGDGVRATKARAQGALWGGRFVGCAQRTLDIESMQFSDSDITTPFVRRAPRRTQASPARWSRGVEGDTRRQELRAGQNMSRESWARI